MLSGCEYFTAWDIHQWYIKQPGKEMADHSHKAAAQVLLGGKSLPLVPPLYPETAVKL
jgi:hypothetical protein